MTIFYRVFRGSHHRLADRDVNAGIGHETCAALELLTPEGSRNG